MYDFNLGKKFKSDLEEYILLILFLDLLVYNKIGRGLIRC